MMRRVRVLAIVIIGIAIVAFVGRMYYAQRAPQMGVVAQAAPLHTYGNPSAPVTVTVYTDLECPHCKHFHETRVTALMSQFPEKLLFVYKNFPLKSHPEAREKAETAECVQQVAGSDAYWSYVSYLFSTEPAEGSEPIPGAPMDAVRRIGVNVDKVQKCLDSGYGAKIVDRDLLEVAARGGHVTPSIYVQSGSTTALVQGESGVAQAIEYVLGTKAK